MIICQVFQNICYSDNIRDWSRPLVRGCGTWSLVGNNTEPVQVDCGAQDQLSGAAEYDCKSCSLCKFYTTAHQPH